MGTCLTCKATVPGYSAPWLDPEDVAPAAPSQPTLPSVSAREPESVSRLLLGQRTHGKRRLTLLAVLRQLRSGATVVWASTSPLDTQPSIRQLLAAEGATEAELRRLTVWNPDEEE